MVLVAGHGRRKRAGFTEESSDVGKAHGEMESGKLEAQARWYEKKTWRFESKDGDVEVVLWSETR